MEESIECLSVSLIHIRIRSIQRNQLECFSISKLQAGEGYQLLLLLWLPYSSPEMLHSLKCKSNNFNLARKMKQKRAFSI